MINAPSAKVRYIIATCIVVVFGTISASIYKSASERRAPNTATVQAQTSEVLLELQMRGGNEDKDLDGLKAWEEALWGTSDTNPDSDGDGTSDFDEVNAGRNPTLAYADELATTTNIDAYTPQETDPNSLTSKIARTVFENVTELTNADTYNSQVAGDVAQQIAQAAASAAEPKIVFTVEQVQILRQPSKEQIKEYGNQIMLIILENMREAYLDPAAYDDLSVSARSFKETADDFALLAVPPQVAGTHSKIINNYYNLYGALEYVYNYQKDPAQALLALRTYSEIAQQQPKLFLIIEEYLRANGIMYEPDEAGAVAFPSLIGQTTNESQ